MTENLSGRGEKRPVFTLLCIFFGLFFVMLFITALCSSISAGLGLEKRTEYLVVSVIQALLCFIFPAWAVARIQSRHPETVLRIDEKTSLGAVFGILIVYLLAQPVMNQIIYWNESMRLPQVMHELEKTLRELEDNSLAVTNVILNDSSAGALISGILIVGCLTGLAEELFFRAGLQRILEMRLGIHWSIWTAALVFSLMHFQFYGFVPRLIMGVFFGYLFYWTGSIWAPVIAHAFNNSVVVLTEWLNRRGITSYDYPMFGVSKTEFPVMAVLSAVAVAVFLWYCRKYFFIRGKRKDMRREEE